MRHWRNVVGLPNAGECCPGMDKSCILKTIMPLTNNITTHTPLLLVSVQTIVIFSTMKSLFRIVRQVYAFSSFSPLGYHLSSVGKGEVSQPRRKREPKGASILIKGPGFWAWDKNSNRRRLASISAGVDGPIDSGTAASGCWAIEGIRQTAYDKMGR